MILTIDLRKNNPSHRPDLGRPLTYSHPRRGAMYLVMIIAMICYIVLGAFVLDVARVTSRKIEMGNIADASTYSTALMKARGMNAVTVSNHHLGEALSSIVLHSAIAGPNVSAKDKNRIQKTLDTSLSTSLKVLGPGAKSVGGWTTTYPANSNIINAGATVCDAKLVLKGKIAAIYQKQIALGAFLPNYYAYLAILELSIEELILKQEWDALERMEAAARQSLPAQRAIASELMGSMIEYQNELLNDIPQLAADACLNLAQQNQGQGASFPSRPELPVEHEEYQANKNNHQRTMARTQIVRAAYPWVVYDRTPVIKKCIWMIDSYASEFYHYWSDFYTTERSLHYYETQHWPMLVMRDNKLPDKGNEIWTYDPEKTDQHFANIGFAFEPSPEPLGKPALKQQNKAGMVTYAQALIYNANPQEPGRNSGQFQPEIGWDTLNWKSPVRASMAYEYKADTKYSSKCPQIEINWQAKLVPVTKYLDLSVSDTPAQVAGVISRITPVPKALRTH
jgi:hypothetical protein